MILTKLNKTKECASVCITDSMKGHYFVVAEFMLGDADSFTSKIQASAKKSTKDFVKVVVALEASKGRYTEDMILADYLDIPYSESSYWSFQGYKVYFMDSNKVVYDVNVSFEENEQNFILSENIL